MAPEAPLLTVASSNEVAPIKGCSTGASLACAGKAEKAAAKININAKTLEALIGLTSVNVPMVNRFVGGRFRALRMTFV